MMCLAADHSGGGGARPERPLGNESRTTSRTPSTLCNGKRIPDERVLAAYLTRTSSTPEPYPTLGSVLVMSHREGESSVTCIAGAGVAC
jgi:hypothetical protein